MVWCYDVVVIFRTVESINDFNIFQKLLILPCCFSYLYFKNFLLFFCLFVLFLFGIAFNLGCLFGRFGTWNQGSVCTHFKVVLVVLQLVSESILFIHYREMSISLLYAINQAPFLSWTCKDRWNMLVLISKKLPLM